MPVPGAAVLGVPRPAPGIAVPGPVPVDTLLPAPQAGETDVAVPQPGALDVALPGPAELTVPVPRIPHVVEVTAPAPTAPGLTVPVPTPMLMVPVPDIKATLPVPVRPGLTVGPPAVIVPVSVPHVEVEACAPPIWWRVLAEYVANASFGAQLAQAMTVAAELSAVGRFTAEVEQSMAVAADYAAAGRLTAEAVQQYVLAPVHRARAQFTTELAQGYARAVPLAARASLAAGLTLAQATPDLMPVDARFAAELGQTMSVAVDRRAAGRLLCALAFPPITPMIQSWNAPGTYTVRIHHAARYLDYVILGSGGGGSSGDGKAADGLGGAAGGWKVGTVDLGDNPTGYVTVTIGAPGVGGAGTLFFSNPGTDGAPTSIDCPFGSDSIYGGAGGNGTNGVGQTKYQGQSPGDQAAFGQTFVGGAVAGKDQPGNAPGGGGGGGRMGIVFPPIASNPGRNGAPGMAWIRQRSS